MSNYFMLDGKKIPMSDETAESLREKAQARPLFDKRVEAIRVSSSRESLDPAGYPIRISIVGRTKHSMTGTYGLPMGEYGHEKQCDDREPGDLLSLEETIELRDILTEAIEYHKEGKE